MKGMPTVIQLKHDIVFSSALDREGHEQKLARAHERLAAIPPRVFVDPNELPPWLEAPLSCLLKRQALGDPI